MKREMEKIKKKAKQKREWIKKTKDGEQRRRLIKQDSLLPRSTLTTMTYSGQHEVGKPDGAGLAEMRVG